MNKIDYALNWLKNAKEHKNILVFAGPFNIGKINDFIKIFNQAKKNEEFDKWATPEMKQRFLLSLKYNNMCYLCSKFDVETENKLCGAFKRCTNEFTIFCDSEVLK